MKLSTGKTITHSRMPNGAMQVDQDLTEKEWEEYCEFTRKIAAGRYSTARVNDDAWLRYSPTFRHMCGQIVGIKHYACGNQVKVSYMGVSCVTSLDDLDEFVF